MKLIKSLFALASATLLVVGCAAQSQGPSTQVNSRFNAGDNADFDLLGLDSPAFAEEKGTGFGMQHGRGMRGQHMAGFLKKLNLSDAQKSQLQAMRKEARADFQNHKETRGQFKQIFKNAFLSAKFETAAVKSQITPLIAAQKEARSQKMAEKMVQVYSILTPEQRQEVYSQLDQVEKKIAGFSKMPFADKLMQMHGHGGGKGQGNRLEKMATELGLSEAQKTQLKDLFEQGQPQRMAQFKELSGVKNQLVTLFQAGTPSVEQVKAVLNTGLKGMETHMDQRLQMMAEVHDLLSPQQREALVTKLETRGKAMQESMKERMKQRMQKHQEKRQQRQDPLF
jgi:protein CpxP